jgi:hypothetical protein
LLILIDVAKEHPPEVIKVSDKKLDLSSAPVETGAKPTPKTTANNSANDTSAKNAAKKKDLDEHGQEIEEI